METKNYTKITQEVVQMELIFHHLFEPDSVLDQIITVYPNLN